MQKYEMSLAYYERVLRKRYKLIIFWTLVVVASGFMVARTKVHLYRAVSSVKIDRSNTLAGLMTEFMYYNTWDNIETQEKMVTSYPVLEISAKEMGRIGRNLTSEQIKDDDNLLGIIKQLGSLIVAGRRGHSNIIDITVTSVNPEEAKEVANTVAYAYKEFTRRERSKTARETRVFVQRQLNLCENNLREAEGRLRGLKEKSGIPSLDDKLRHALVRQTEVSKTNELLSNQMENLAAQVSELKKRSENPYSKIEERTLQPNIDWVSGMGDLQDPGLTQLNSHLISLELEKSENLNYYTAANPRIADLEVKIQTIISQILREYQVRLEQFKKRYQENLTVFSEQEIVLKNLPREQLETLRAMREVKINEEIFSLLSTKLQEAMIKEAGSLDEVVVLSHAMRPTAPINVNRINILITSLIVGLMLSLFLALVLETLDTSIGTIEDVESFLQLPVIGVILHADFGKILHSVTGLELGGRSPDRTPGVKLVTQIDPKSPEAESYRSLRTNIQFLEIDKKIKTMVFTSSVMQEGKSTVLANLALTLAQAGYRTLVVGCNLRRPTDYRIFGLSMGPGVTDILIEKAHWKSCLRTIKDMNFGELNLEDRFSSPSMENLHVITIGSIPPNPSELLNSKQMDKFLAEVRENYDYVLIDAPPILPVTDSAILARKVDGVIMVYQVNRVPRNALRRAKTKLESVGGKVLGLILNNTKAEVTSYFAGAYKYTYYYQDDSEKRRRRRKTASSFKVFSILAGMLTAAAGLLALPYIAPATPRPAEIASIFRGLWKPDPAYDSASRRAAPSGSPRLPERAALPPAAAPAATLPTTPVLIPPRRESPAPEPKPDVLDHLFQSEPETRAGQPGAGTYFIQLSRWSTETGAIKALASARKVAGEKVYLLKTRDGYRVCYEKFRGVTRARAALKTFPHQSKFPGLFVSQAPAAHL